MKNVLLVNTNTERSPYPVPPLGLCLLASCLEDRFKVKVYDGVFDEGKALPDIVRTFQPDFIGFSIRNIDDVVMDREIFYVDSILDQFIRPVKAMTSAVIILGGSGFSMFPVELMTLSGADYGIAGEGEVLLPLLLDRLTEGAGTDDLPNVIKAGREVVQSGRPSMAASDVRTTFAEIDRHIDFLPYKAKGVYSVQTKRGCAHRCIYCTYPLIEGRKFRPRNPSVIADEIEQARDRLGDVTFEFVDSTFNDPAGHAEAICRELIRRRVRVRLRTMGINPRNTSDVLFELMLEAGFVQIDATPDSASPVMLKNLGKGFSLAEVRRMARLLTKHNLPSMWFFLFGGPGENEETFRETLDFIDHFINPADLVYMNAGMRIYPGTPLYRIAVGEGLVKPGLPILKPPAYYYAPELGKARLDQLIRAASQSRCHCLPATETTPSADMITEAMELKKTLTVSEPMFRTLLRIRKRRMQDGKE